MMREKWIIAHRGATRGARENTLKAFEEAVRVGADMIEFDVRKSGDGVFVIHHDDTLQDRPIREWTYDQILSLDPAVPTLEQTLTLTQGRVKLDVELKETGDEKPILDLILNHFEENAFVVTSFHDRSLLKVKALYPAVRVGLLLGRDNLKKSLLPLGGTLKQTIDFLAPHWKLLQTGLLRLPEKFQRSLLVWTVNDEAMIRDFYSDDRVRGIITDNPETALSMKMP